MCGSTSLHTHDPRLFKTNNGSWRTNSFPLTLFPFHSPIPLITFRSLLKLLYIILFSHLNLSGKISLMLKAWDNEIRAWLNFEKWIRQRVITVVWYSVFPLSIEMMSLTHIRQRYAKRCVRIFTTTLPVLENVVYIPETTTVWIKTVDKYRFKQLFICVEEWLHNGFLSQNDC